MPGYCFNSDYLEKETTWAPGVGPGKHEGKQDGLFFFLTAALDAADVKFWCNLNRFNAPLFPTGCFLLRLMKFQFKKEKMTFFFLPSVSVDA